MAESVARRSYGKLVALLVSRTGDLGEAEDALSEAFLSALESWPRTGCPANPEAWLLAVARRKGIDFIRRRRSLENAVEQLELRGQWFGDATSDAAIPDHRLALMFTCAHPAIEPGVRAPLILQVVLGLNAAMIASAFLTSPATMGQRLVRAKHKIKQAGIAFRIPDREDLAGRLDAVLEAIYATFSEGWTDPGGTDAARRDLAEEALFLGGLVAEVLPEEAETLGLLSLMLHAEARRGARRNAQGDFVPLAEQDTSLWDRKMIHKAEELLTRASTLGNLGRYQLEAALQSAHVYRLLTGEANWSAVVQLYDALWGLSRSPVIAINRALALTEIQGADAGLRAIDEIAADTRLREYQPYWAARADLLARTGANREARHAYEIAIGLERDTAVRRYLQRRQSALPF